MSVARVTEISALSPESFEAAINEGITRAANTLRGVRSAWIKDMNVEIQDGNVTGYRVSMAITFVLEDPREATPEATAVTEVDTGVGTAPPEDVPRTEVPPPRP